MVEALVNGLFYERPVNPFLFLQGCIDRVVENGRAGLAGPSGEQPRRWDAFISRRAMELALNGAPAELKDAAVEGERPLATTFVVAAAVLGRRWWRR